MSLVPNTCRSTFGVSFEVFAVLRMDRIKKHSHIDPSSAPNRLRKNSGQPGLPAMKVGFDPLVAPCPHGGQDELHKLHRAMRMLGAQSEGGPSWCRAGKTDLFSL